jgi:RHS repeat-associated protein
VSVSGPGVSARTATTTYDARGRFPVGSANALGHTETRTFDARFGTALSHTGPNNLTTTWQVDTFGRTVLETRPDGTTAATAFGTCATGCPAGAVRKITVTASGAAPVTTYFDLLGREIRTETVGFDGRAVYQDTEYDTLGRVARSSLPYYSNEPAYYARNTYDLMDRVVTQTAPDDTVTTTAYNGYTTSLTNALGQTSTRLTNSQGQLVRATDALGGAVNYVYDALGNLTRVTDPAGNVTTQTFDLRGRKVAMTDPDLGAWTYVYNALGELTSQTDAKAQTTTQAYDALGRMTSRTELEGTTTWTYDTSANGIGKPASVAAPGAYLQVYVYDTLGRLTRTDTTTDTVTRSVATSYDAFSRPQVLTYPGGFAVQQTYTAQGYLSHVRNAATQALFWQADGARPDGTVSAFSLGNGLSTVRLYDARRGDLTFVSTGFGPGTTVQNLAYTWDALGNLTQRRDVNQNLTESFTYDALNRLTQATIAGVGSKTYAYSAIGNLTSKSGVGSYTYGAKPHAVTQAGTNTYAYDANGNLTAGAGRTLTWDSANRATQISRSGASSTFFYGPDGARWKQVKVVGAQTTTTRYLGALYEEITAAGVTEKKHYVFAGSERVALYSTKSSGQTSLKYLHLDHLGSTDTVTDAAGAVTERLSYDPHGKRRNANWTDALAQLAGIATDRGFTGHEHLDDLGLIHMNGRVYDPTLGRFLSADPVIQFPEASQGLNRYSYVLNNPLSFTDPTGLFLGGVFKAIGNAFKAVFKAIKSVFKNPYVRLAIGIAAGFYGGAWFATALNYAQGTLAYSIAAGASGGFIAGAIIGGTPEAALFGGLTGGIFGAVGGWAQVHNWGLSKQVFAHALAGGTTARLQGGAFQSGMLSAGFVQWASPYVEHIRLSSQFLARAARVTASAVIGGTASAIGGGKFANGANTAAFLVTTVEAAGYFREQVGGEPTFRPGENRDEPFYEYDPETGRQRVEDRTMNVFGNNDPGHFCSQGTTCSKVGNALLGNPVARVHDYWLNSRQAAGLNVTATYNIGTMAPAVGVAYAAVIGRPVSALSASQLISSSVATSFDSDDDRRLFYGAAAIGTR